MHSAVGPHSRRPPLLQAGSVPGVGVDVFKAKDLRAEIEAELQAEADLKRTIARAQRDMTKARLLAVERERMDRNRKAGLEARDDKNYRTRVLAAFSAVEPASAEEVQALSKMMNKRFNALSPDKPGEWFRVFRSYDAEGSGLMTYQNLLSITRNELQLRKEAVPERHLQQLWKHLDPNATGVITAGAFSRFLRLTAPDEHGGSRARVKLQAAKAAIGARVRMAEGRSGEEGRALAQKLSNVEPASDEQVRGLVDYLSCVRRTLGRRYTRPAPFRA